VAILPVFVYSKLMRVPYVVDAHSGAFLNPRWRRLQWLQRALSRAAATTIVTNTFLAGQLESRRIHATIIRDVPVVFPKGRPFGLTNTFSVAVICSFNYDEPIREILDAAAQLPDVRFYVTGNPRHLDPSVAAAVPANVTLTGFLSTEQYGALLSEAHAALTLTTLDHTMLRGAYEAIYQGTPVIISDSELLRDAFPLGAVHVENTVGAIRKAVEDVRDNYDHHKSAAQQLRAQKVRTWEAVQGQLMRQLGLARQASPSR
jgi:glycosyltransferase involved in cell wall biosynthesis